MKDNAILQYVARNREYAELFKNPEFTPSKELLSEITNNFNNIISFINEIMINEFDGFYSLLMLEMEFQVDYNIRCALDTDISREPFKILMNPIFAAQYTLKELNGLLLAELLRVTYLHPALYSKINPSADSDELNKLQLASETNAQTLLEKDLHNKSWGRDFNGKDKAPYAIPDDFGSTSDVRVATDKNIQKDQSIEYYYGMLKMFCKDPKKVHSGNGGGGMGGANGNSSSNGNDNNNFPATPQNGNGQNQHQSWCSTDKEKTESSIKNMISSVYNNMSAKQRGELPSGLASHIEKLMKPPEINWKQILSKFVGTVPFPFRKTPLRLNRRQPFRRDLMGKISDRKLKVVVAIDTSGSMDDRTLEYCMNEVFNIVKAQECEVTIIECDAQIQKVYVAAKPSEVCPKLNGRGGTAFTPVINYINENPHFRDSLLIYFTDGYGESEIPRPMNLKNLWVVMEDEKYLSVKESYGIVKALKKDEEYKKFMNN